MSVQVHVKFFAIFREYVGLKQDWHDIEPGITVQELWDYYTAHAKNPRVGNIRAAFSVNQRLAKPDTILNGGEEVGFLPPVSGGAGSARKPRSAKAAGSKRSAKRPVQVGSKSSKKKTASAKAGSARHTAPSTRTKTTKRTTAKRATAPSLTRDFLVTEAPLSHDALIARVAHPGAGAIITFLGVVRDNANNQSVKFLEYEAYPELAEQMLAQIGAEAQSRWQDARIAIAHRVGRLEIGEPSVIIATSAPHRAEAFSACRFAIERLKVILPVWKKEFATDTDYWVEGPVAGETPPANADEIVLRQEAPIETPSTFGMAGTDAMLSEIRADLEGK